MAPEENIWILPEVGFGVTFILEILYSSVETTFVPEEVGKQEVPNFNRAK